MGGCVKDAILARSPEASADCALVHLIQREARWSKRSGNILRMANDLKLPSLRHDSESPLIVLGLAEVPHAVLLCSAGRECSELAARLAADLGQANGLEADMVAQGDRSHHNGGSGVGYEHSVPDLRQSHIAQQRKSILAYQPAACGRYIKAQLLDLLPWFACIPVVLQAPHLVAAPAPNC
jgi:hypothetical protein